MIFRQTILVLSLKYYIVARNKPCLFGIKQRTRLLLYPPESEVKHGNDDDDNINDDDESDDKHANHDDNTDDDFTSKAPSQVKTA